MKSKIIYAFIEEMNQKFMGTTYVNILKRGVQTTVSNRYDFDFIERRKNQLNHLHKYTMWWYRNPNGCLFKAVRLVVVMNRSAFVSLVIFKVTRPQADLCRDWIKSIKLVGTIWLLKKFFQNSEYVKFSSKRHLFDRIQSFLQMKNSTKWQINYWNFFVKLTKVIF